MKKLFTKTMAVIAILLLSSWSVNAEIYFDLTTVGGTKVMDYDAVSTERNKVQTDRWITVVNFGNSGTSGKCGTASKTFDIKLGRTIDFYLAKCDKMIISANIASGRSLVVNIDGGSNITLAGTGGCVDYEVLVNKESNTIIRVQGASSSSSWTSFFTFTYTPKNPSITSFIAAGINATINQSEKTITAELPYGTNLSSINPTVIIGGTATSYSPSGAQDFSGGPVNYIASDGVPANDVTYAVTLTAAAVPSSEKDLSSVTISGLTPTFDAGTNTYSIILPKASGLTQAVSFTKPLTASTDFTSGNTHDFTNPLSITVTAQDLSTKVYTLTAVNANKNIAYIINTAVTAQDTKIRPELAKTYYLDNILIANVTTTTDFSMYDMVILTESPSSGSAGMKALWGINKPLLGLKMFSVNSNTWNQATATNPAPSVLGINVNEPNHPIFAGITLTGTFANELEILSAITTGNGIQQSTYAADYAIANIKGAVLSSIIEFPVGKTSDMAGTTNAALQSKLMIVSIANDNQNNLTADGLNLVKNACTYLMGTTSWGTDAGTMFKNLPVTLRSTVASGVSATLDWDPVPGAVKYIITKVSPAGVKQMSKVKSAINAEVAGNVLQYEMTDLTGQTEYTYSVAAQNAAGTLSLVPGSTTFITGFTGINLNTIQGITFDGKTIHNAENIDLKVFDTTGRLIVSSAKDINMGTQAKGIYIVKSERGILKIAL
ncbi:MAG TPA: fibronectin type III domain-containing protein [Paludibacter sp.]|nr:fibronectin type III domain-containing protein [Paludibacter sp.]